MSSPRDVLAQWVAAFNAHDARAAAALYHDDATNWQVAAGDPVVGREAILKDLVSFFSAFPDSFTRVENFCATGMEAFRNAAFAVASGMYDVVLALGAEKMKDRGGRGIARDYGHPAMPAPSVPLRRVPRHDH